MIVMCVSLTMMIFTFTKIHYKVSWSKKKKVSWSILGKEFIKGGYMVGKRCPCHISGPPQGRLCNFSYGPPYACC